MDTTNILRFVSLDYLLQRELGTASNPDLDDYPGENLCDDIMRLCENTND